MEHAVQVEQPVAGIDTIEHYNPVEVREVIGLALMSILAFALFIALLKSEARNRALLREFFRNDQNFS